MPVSSRTLSTLGLFALLPVAAYAALEASVVALSVACVLLIVGSLYVMFSPSTGDEPRPSR
jgi:hypothetical protein